MLYLFFVSLFFTALQACEIVNVLYVDDSRVLRATTARQVQSYNSEALNSLLPFLENRGVTTLKDLISFSSYTDNNEIVGVINSAILENSDSGIMAKLNKHKILKKRNKIFLSRLIEFLKERDTSTMYQIALARLIDLALLKPLTLQEKAQRRFSSLCFSSNRNLAPTTPIKLINFTLLEDGNLITLQALTDVHLVWCDIQMQHENGNIALARLQNEALSINFRLPPFAAITSVTDYHNTIDWKPSSKALKEGFIIGQNKIKKEDIPLMFEFCERTLGTHWLATHVGAILKPVAESLRDNWIEHREEQQTTDDSPTRRSQAIAGAISCLTRCFCSRKINPANNEHNAEEHRSDQQAFTISKKYTTPNDESKLPIHQSGSAEQTFNSDHVVDFVPLFSPRNARTQENTPVSNLQKLSQTNSITEEKGQLFIPVNLRGPHSRFANIPESI